MNPHELADLLEQAARELRRLAQIEATPISRPRRKHISATEYAAKIGVHPDTVQRMCRKGILIARRVGRNWQINEEASERALSLAYGNPSEKSLARAR